MHNKSPMVPKYSLYNTIYHTYLLYVQDEKMDKYEF